MTTYAKKTCWLIGAIVFFILGIIGIIFPVIPQIPFLIIAFFVYLKAHRKSIIGSGPGIFTRNMF